MDNVNSNIRILVVDDTPKNIQLLGTVLRDEGYETNVAQSGEQALKILEKVRPDLILLDVMMPGLDGFETCKRLKADPVTSSIPVIFLTAKTETADIVKGFELGAVDYVTKPFNTTELLARVNTHVQLKKAHEKIEQQAVRLEELLIEQEKIGDNLILNVLELQASNRKLEDLDSMKNQLLSTMHTIEKEHFPALNESLESLVNKTEGETKELAHQSVRRVHLIDEILQPFESLYLSEKGIQSKHVLLAESNKKQQIIAKMALKGTGVELDIVSNVEEGQQLLSEKNFDVLCVDCTLIELADIAHQQSSEIQIVLMTSRNVPEYLPILQQHSYLSNTVSRNDEDRSFTLKNITTTISKLINQDLFGLEKYLNWGVEVKEHPITSSEDRSNLVDIMVSYFNQLGVRRPILKKCEMVVEELLMNSIYDAPVDSNGKSLYNHLSRTEVVELLPEQQGTFCYACDGILLAVSVRDPFGALDRQTILDYFESCYEGKGGALQKNKGGAGRGLFQIIETSDLVVMNVKPEIRTEVIVIFNIDPDKAKSEKTTSFHYFYG